MIRQYYRLRVFDYGAKTYHYENKLHRIWPDGDQFYYINDQCVSKEDFYENYYQKKND